MPLERHFKMSEVLPHEGGMLLIDEILDAGPEHITCGITIRSDSIFCEGSNGVPAWVGIEFMAQTACAYSGLEEARLGKAPSIGLLLGSRRYTVDMPYFAVGVRLRVHAELLLRDENDLVAFACTIADGDRVIARGDVKALRPHDVLAVIRGERLEAGKS